MTSGQYGKGSKSEREAVCIENSGARYILRRKNGPIFGDTELVRYIGHNVQCDGFLASATLVARRIEVVESGERGKLGARNPQNAFNGVC